ncbi:MAG: hypothetical protein ABI865_06130 [Nitrosospira sp.]
MSIKNLSILITFFLSGCASVYQTKFGIEDIESKHITARPYYLPKGFVSFSSSIDKGGIATFTMTPKFVPDTIKTLYLVRNHNGFYDDNFVVQTTIDGLLTSVNTTTTYKGLEIAGKIGELAGIAAQIAALKANEQTPECTPPMPATLDLELDPTDLEDANSKLKAYCFRVIPESVIPSDDVNYLNNTNLPPINDGIAYRSTTNILLSAEYTGASQYMKKVFRVNIPDITKIVYAPIKRSFFVTRQHDYTFSNGVLTSSTVVHPSEVLGLISTPVAILNGIAQAITGRFGKKTASLTDETAYINAQKTLIESQKNLEEARKK